MATVTMALSSFAVAGRRTTVCFSAAGVAPRRRSPLVVRAQSEVSLTADHTLYSKPDVDPTQENAAVSPSSPFPTPSNPKPKAVGGGAKLSDVFAFSGPAPERINGRLAMVGFVSALAVEASRGGGILAQAGSDSGLAWFAVTAAVLSVASLVPLLRGESAEARSGAVMSANAELWNGRFAMLGLVALALTEYLTGAPFVNI
ncbi:hypothetical protein ABZP36_002186 [Zizania latifolia]